MKSSWIRSKQTQNICEYINEKKGAGKTIQQMANNRGMLLWDIDGQINSV